MMASTFDRHTYIKKFTAKGMSEELAEDVTDAIKASRDIDFSHLATKADLAELKAATKADLAELKAEIIKWMFGGLISTVTLLLGIIGLLVTVLLKLH
jgi:hypothetical protein